MASNGASFVAQLVKNMPAMQETWVQFLGWEDSLEKGKATDPSILAWRIPRTLGVTMSQTRLSLSNFYFHFQWGFPGGISSKEPACSAGDLGSIPGLGRPPGEANGNPLQYPCLEISWTQEPGGLQSMGSQRVRHD